jgi:ubiquinone/menaquinone biosynthesis C-methylase UbiE
MEDLFFEIYESLPRQGPGDDMSTQKVYKKLEELPKQPEILDIGCGTGRQTLVLLKISYGNITALDNHPQFIETLQRNASKAGYMDRIRCVVGDMKSMNFTKESFDLIWCEGAAYFMGFGKALHGWKPLLRPKGYMVISELVWFKEKVPQEIKDYFAGEYSDMNYYKNIYSIIESAGYKIIDYFPLPDDSWWNDYYTLVEKKIADIRSANNDNQDAQQVFDLFQLEMNMHKKYSKYYGYSFYVMRKED